MANVFSVQIFFIVFRECLEASVIISVLLAFAKQGLGGNSTDLEEKKLYKRLVWQIWIGSLLGLFICLCIGGAFIGVFYTVGKDIWAQSEDLWEGIFSLIAVVMITIMGIAMLRLNKMQEKWRVKIAKAILESAQEVLPLTQEERARLSMIQRWKASKPIMKLRLWSKKYALCFLPFVTTLREGVEAIVFVGGVSLSTPATAFPLAVICGLGAGIAVGYIIYKGGNAMSIQLFLIVSTCLLYLIGAGLWSRAIWYFQMYDFSKKAGGDVAENGSGPGSYNIKQSVWHVNCCNPETDNGWRIFNALLGWQNSATYGSVISYNIYWLFIIVLVAVLMYEEKHGRLPLIGSLRRGKRISEEEKQRIVEDAKIVAAQQYGAKLSEKRGVTVGDASSTSTDSHINRPHASIV